jgi:hypothetical protein
MAKQKNSAPEKSSTPAASGSGGNPAPAQTIRKISVPSPGGKHIGPDSAPYYEKT